MILTRIETLGLVSFWHELLSETHKGLKRVTLICLLCPMLVIIQFRKYHIWNEKKKKWPRNGGKTPESRESFQRLKPGILPKH